MPPRGVPESSPPRQGAPNLLLSIVPRRYDTSHHAGGLPQSATSSSASSSESDGNPTQNLGRVEWLLQTTKPLHLLQLPRQPAGITSCFHPYSRSAQIGCRCTWDADDRCPPLSFWTWRCVCRYTPKSPFPFRTTLHLISPSRRHCDTVLQAQAYSRSAQTACCCTRDACVLRPASNLSPLQMFERPGDVSVDTLPNTLSSFRTTLHHLLAKPSPLRHCAASKGAFTQTVAAAHGMPMLASNIQITISIKQLAARIVLSEHIITTPPASPSPPASSVSRHHLLLPAPQCAYRLPLHRDADVRPLLLQMFEGPGDVSIDTLPNPLPVPCQTSSHCSLQAVAIATVCCKWKRICADRCSCT